MRLTWKYEKQIEVDVDDVYKVRTLEFRPPKRGERYLCSTDCCAQVAGGDFPLDEPRIVIVKK